MALPVSMEDTELFGKTKCLDTELPVAGIKLDVETFDQMFNSLTKLWWSRLIISVRGYVINYYLKSEETIFLVDDAFINLHRAIVEGDRDTAHQILNDLDVVTNVKDIGRVLDDLASGVQISEEIHPFFMPATQDAFRRVFGPAELRTYYSAAKQKIAYFVFMRIFAALQDRWKVQSAKKKSIRFEEDPEWQPDDRVVLFEQFFQGNRTWVLTDFDRHVLMCWRPHGVAVIFGDRYTQTKVDEGYKLCSHCGMLEQHPDQFPGCPKCLDAFYCSKDCLDADEDAHTKKCH